MEATETMVKTAQMPAMALMVETMVITKQMVLTEPLVMMERTIDGPHPPYDAAIPRSTGCMGGFRRGAWAAIACLMDSRPLSRV